MNLPGAEAVFAGFCPGILYDCREQIYRNDFLFFPLIRE